MKKNNFRLIFFVLLGLFISETGFADKDWIKEYVRVIKYAENDYIAITATVHSGSYGVNSGDGFLKKCLVEASVDGKKYFTLMEIETPWQENPKFTTVKFKNKTDKALINFTKNVITSGYGSVWPEYSKSQVTVAVPNIGKLAVVGIGWKLKDEFRGVCYIRISGKCLTSGPAPDPFSEVVYNLNNPDQYALKSNTQDTITKESEKDIVHILKDSETIVINGVELGANIKVYNTAGVELQSTISKSDAVNIKLPAKQIYIFQIGKSRYKVAM